MTTSPKRGATADPGTSCFQLTAMRNGRDGATLGGMALRCLIVDDNASFLEAATDLLRRQGMAVVGVASSGDEAVVRVRELRPDVALVDIKLGADSGFEVARRLADLGFVDLKVILISTHAEADYAELIDSAPVAGFVSKVGLSAEAIEQLIGAGE
jgi:DNA-binding NarL/FixJ family response regulator